MTKSIRVPAQLRKHVTRTVKPKTQGERELIAACEAGARELERQGRNNMNSIDLDLTNEALGVVLKLARGWLDSDNGNNVMAAKSMLKFELEYEPDDPREIRHLVKLPKSLAGEVKAPYTLEFKKDKTIPADVKADMKGMSWTSTGASGRVRIEALGWFLEKARYWTQIHPTPSVQRAAKKFIGTYTEAYEQTQRLIAGSEEIEDQAPEVDVLAALDFKAAVEGQEPEVQRKRLVVIACGGKKSTRLGKIPADERYIGNYFTACRLAADVMDGPTMVLSAKYGLIPLTEEIDYYDVKIGQRNTITVGAVRAQVEALGLEDAKVTVLGGEKYVKAARQIWPDADAPLKGGIGQQLKQLSEMYDGEVFEDDEDQDQEPEAKAEGPKEWNSGQLRNVMNLPGRNRGNEPGIWFGGKAGKRNPEPGKWVKAKIVYTGDGQYDLVDLATDETLLTATLATQIHWAGYRDQAPAVEEVQEPAAVEEVVPAGEYEVPENWLELAQEGNTDAAKAYWTRRCEEYRRTGK
ncbi:DUF6884 domain-containing protein [Streptomyces sp. NPDC056696]|uniref:DUF6884 domain-containing protein n=1 Tax=unclassified Streptomyces TaxID=2593676 RepID=UPI003652EE41